MQDPLGLLTDSVPFRLTTPSEVRVARDWLLDEGRDQDASALSRAAVLFFAEQALHAIRMRFLINRREAVPWQSRQASALYLQQQDELCRGLRRLGTASRLTTQHRHLERASQAVDSMIELRQKHTHAADDQHYGRFRLRFLRDLLQELQLLTGAEMASTPEKPWSQNPSGCASTHMVGSP
jgi:DNA-directed RNA polymerase beta subunit